MAHLFARITNITPGADDIQVTGVAHVQGAAEEVGWIATLAWTELQSTFDSTCLAVAVAAAQAAGHTVGMLDNRIIK